MEKRRIHLATAASIMGLLCMFAVLAAAAPKQRPNDRVLEKRTFIHYQKGHAPDHPGKPDKDDDGYYTYIAHGVHWAEPEDFIYSLKNTESEELAPRDVANAISDAMGEWEEHGGASIFGELSRDDEEAVWNDAAPDDKNTFTFGPYPGNDSVIAVTNVWGYFSGPPASREIIEVDVLFNTSYVWGIVEGPDDSSLMDLQNIATHEIGHCAGMGDLYNADAGEDTMYGYSTEGETKKRDLYTGDIAGITALYQ